jgi:hypothetical protein
MTTSDHASALTDIRQHLRDAVDHLEHVLPGQAPIQDFVHHNTLHGFQHLPFHQALAEAERRTGNRGYLPPERFRALFAAGRITREDLVAALDEAADLEPDVLILDAEPPLRRREVYLATLLHPCDAVVGPQLAWQVEELDACCRFQPDVAPESRQRLLDGASRERVSGEESAIAELWSACLGVFGLEHYVVHPEDLLDLSSEQAEQMLAELGREGAAGQPIVTPRLRREAAQDLQGLLDRVGPGLTLSGLLQELTGEDLREAMRPLLVRHLAPHLDLGHAPWHAPDRTQGLYHAWRAAARYDLAAILEDLHAWHDELDALPEDPLDAVIAGLKRIGIAQDRWCAYLERLALELPGWSGMILWRDHHPAYKGLPTPVAMMDYLAVRLTLERIFGMRLCRRHWQVEASLDMLRWYFRRNPEELYVRHALFATRLPEYLATRAQHAVAIAGMDPGGQVYGHIAELIWTWRRSPSADRPEVHTVFHSAWPLFRLAQHLGLTAGALRRLGTAGAEQLLDCLPRLDPGRRGQLWLEAYERHYREQVLATVAANHGRGRWASREETPSAQVMLCMDDREEGIRRHLEELAPEVETLGAAAHFNVPHNWRGLDDLEVSALAPVIPAPVIPAHEVREEPRPEAAEASERHARRHNRLRSAGEWLLQSGRRGLLAPAAVAALAGPLALPALVGKTFAPRLEGGLARRLGALIEGQVPTRLRFTAPNDSPPATEAAPRLGFTDDEQAERVANLLRGSGLTSGFAPLVAILGHGSVNQNNPHAPAYNCGACSGRFSGPNARLVAAMANRGQVRERLAAIGIEIPAATWFVAGEHDTGTDLVHWYDLEDLPAAKVAALVRLRADLDEAGRLHAQERCRRFASAPAGMDPIAAARHAAGRSLDFSQARPELGHATNACAFIGRRAMTRGAFFDRRAFLISYDPTQDPSGAILERHLVTNGAVGAGISLEYYFSSADNDRYGSGSKVTHNVTGLFAVMDGTASDLRTGLPSQMIEIHEAMRLLIVVEQSLDVLTAIYERQPAVRELVGNAWVQLVAKDPESGAIHRFRPGLGWVRWDPPARPVPRAERSQPCYAGRRDPCPPALIAAPDERAAHA